MLLQDHGSVVGCCGENGGGTTLSMSSMLQNQLSWILDVFLLEGRYTLVNNAYNLSIYYNFIFPFSLRQKLDNEVLDQKIGLQTQKSMMQRKVNFSLGKFLQKLKNKREGKVEKTELRQKTDNFVGFMTERLTENKS